MKNSSKSIFVRFGAVFAALFFCGLLFSCAGSPQAEQADFGGLGKASDPVPFMAAARTGTLPSGLRYYILENSRPQNRAYLTLAVNAGSVLEADDERGLAHFVEHMAFNGTSRFPKQELINYLRSLGMRFGADANAYTSYDSTVYGIEVPVEMTEGRRRIPDRALAIIDDWTRALSFVPSDVDSERSIIMEEYRTRLGAMDRVREVLLPVIFQGSRYAERKVIGLREIIEKAPAEKLAGFYRRWYRADNMALVFVGDFDGQALEEELAVHFGIPAPEAPVNRPVFDLPPPQKGNFRAEIVTDPELTNTVFSIYWKQNPDPDRGSLGAYRQAVMDNLIDSMLSLRFEEAAANPESSHVGAWGYNWRWAASARFYVMGVQAKTGAVEEALRELLLEKEAMARYGFTGAELERAKLSLLSSLEQAVSEKDRQESQNFVRNFTSHFLEGEITADLEWELDAVRRLLPGIGKAEIAGAVKNYFAADDLTLFLMAPEADAPSLPQADRIRAIFAETAGAEIRNRESEVLSADLIDRDPAPGTIRAASLDRETGARIWELSNGAKVILKETDNRNNEIVLYALARGGSANVPEAQDISAGLAAEMLSASGLGPYSRPDLIRKLAGRQVSFSFRSSKYYRTFEGSSSTGDLETLFQMLYLGFTQPRIDDGAVQALLDQYRTNLARDEENPETVFYHEVTRTVYGGHPRFKPMELGDLEKVSINDALEYIRACLNPGDYTFVFTGNINPETMKALAETWLASIPPGASMNAWNDPGIVRPGQTEKQVFKGKEEQSMVFLGWFAPMEFSEEKSQAAAIVTEYLDIVLTEEIREKLGGVYSSFARASVTPIPKGEGTLSVYFYCDPRRAGELVSAVRALIASLAEHTNGDVFDKAVEALLKEHERSMQNNSYIAQSYANSAALYDSPLSRLAGRPDILRSLRPARIRSMIRELLSGESAQVVLYPEGWKN
ncbi:MAG: insulinase family protein [Treponema sp.]|jgi:zinc protease|nr:insulinase family protein [Treponema sp.]